MSTSNLLAELKRRNVIRMAGLYLVGAWLITQVSSTLLPVFEAPSWVMKTLVGLLAVGFVPALVIAWVFELTPEGIKRDAEVKPEESIAPQTARRPLSAIPGLRGTWAPARRMDRALLVLLSIALVYFAFDKFVLAPRRDVATAVAAKGSAESLVAAAVNRKSVAVLPFENLSRDPENAYFVEGIQDEILTRLAGISALKVISRTSTMRYASRPEDLKEIAKQLGVANVIEGSVQRAGNTTRVNVQLIEAESDSHLWAESFDRDVQNIFAVETEVAQKVAEALRAALLPAETTRVASVPTKSPGAYDLFLKGEYLLNQIEASTAKDPAEAAHQAQAFYAGAIAADPAFALAHAQLAYLGATMYWRSIDASAQGLEAAQSSANRALALQPDLPAAHLAQGYLHYWGHRDYAAALTEFATARASLPNDSNVFKAIAYVYRRQGQLAQAVPELERAAELDPRDAGSSRELGVTLGLLRRYDKAAAALNRSLALAPDSVETHLFLALSLLFSGNPEGAKQSLSTLPADIDPQGLVSFTRFAVAMAAHQPDEALAALAKTPESYVDPADNTPLPSTLLRAQALAMKGETGPAHAAFEEARLVLEKRLSERRDSAEIQIHLAAVYAGLGQKTAALAAGRRAIELMPLTKDLIGGISCLGQLAQVEAQVGESQSAIDHLEQLMALPAGFDVSTASMRFDPTWDPLRQEPRFQKLIAKYEAAPAPHPAQPGAKP